MDTTNKAAQRLPAEIYYADELAKLRQADPYPRPPGWCLSPKGVEAFVLGDADQGSTRKFVAPAAIVTRVIISLASSCSIAGTRPFLRRRAPALKR